MSLRHHHVLIQRGAQHYAANIAVAVQILEGKWNQAQAQGLVANGGNPANIESWYFAVWGYNSGIYAPSGSNPDSSRV